MTDLKMFRIFNTVVLTGSFATAARSLGITRSAVAKAIGRLEEQTATRLFHRNTRSVVLTHDGEALYMRSAGAVRELEEALEGMSGKNEEPSGTLHISVPHAYGKYRVQPALTAFLKRWPALEADVVFAERPIDVVAERFDLVIQPGDFPTGQGLITCVLSNHRMGFYASPAYLEACGEPESIEALKRHSCLLVTEGASLRPWTARVTGGQLVSFLPKGRARFSNCIAGREAAVDGLGILQLPDYLVQQDLSEGLLRQVLIGAEPPAVPIIALYPSKKHLASKVRLFIDELMAAPR